MNRSKIISIVLAGSIIVGGSTYAMASKASRNEVKAKNKVIIDSASNSQENNKNKSESKENESVENNGNISEKADKIEKDKDNIGTEDERKVQGETTPVTENKKVQSKVSEDDLNKGLRYLQYDYGQIAAMSYNEKLEICKENKDTIISVKKQIDEDRKINSLPPSEESQSNKLDIVLREKGYPQSVINKLTEKEKEEFSKWEGNYRSHWGTLGWNESRREQQ